MIYTVETNDIYETLSEEDKKEYNKAYLRGISALQYLEYYDNISFDNISSLNMGWIYKTILTVCFLKNDIFKDEKPNRGAKEGYKEFIYQSNKTLDFITGIINNVESRKKVKDFFG